MNQLERVQTEYNAARDVIAKTLLDTAATWRPKRADEIAEAIIARLCAHNPPILLEMKQPDKETE